MATNDNVITIFTDGACRGNPGPGGWGAVLIYQEHTKTISGGESNTTNNRMELMAVIMALEALKKPSQVIICTDSQYTKNGMTQWISAWKARNWKTSDNKPVKNKELWQRLENAAQQHTITWKWVKGHSGLAGNEQADELARQAIPNTYDL